ncbi:unnamed protein product [Oppiella nova]|uniref:Uncharacterized protein n=1 Tax=Oppiella nova TaxID=334625 RepID=A0A7R9M6Y0_9ACAR|nr:unnamed protein product [Oppiella nova]CAG2170612.1 unnamed protein product [Oppiella nova]
MPYISSHSPGLTQADWEHCRGRHPLCPSDCLDIQDPVCAAKKSLNDRHCSASGGTDRGERWKGVRRHAWNSQNPFAEPMDKSI